MMHGHTCMQNTHTYESRRLLSHPTLISPGIQIKWKTEHRSTINTSLKKMFYLFVYFCVCEIVGMCACVQMLWRPEASDPLELELQASVSSSVLGTELRSSVTAVHNFHLKPSLQSYCI